MRYEYAAFLATAEEGGFVVRVPAIPEAHTQGDTIEKAIENAREVIALCLDVRRERDQEIPASDANARLEIVSIDDAE